MAIENAIAGLLPVQMQTHVTRRRHWSLAAVVVLVLGLAFDLALLAAGAGLASLYRSDAILPGIHALGVDLDGLTQAQAMVALHDAWQARAVTLDAGADGAWTVTPEAAGLRLDAEATAAAAYAAGRSFRSPAELTETLLRLAELAGRRLPPDLRVLAPIPAPVLYEVAPIWRFDAPALVTTLRPIAGKLAVQMQDARVWISDGRVASEPSATGRGLDLSATLALAEQNAARLADERRLTVAVITATPTVADVSAEITQAKALLAQPVTLQVYDPISDERLNWVADAKMIGGWLSQPTGGTSWEVQRGAVEAWVQGQAKVLDDWRYIESDKAVDGVMGMLRERARSETGLSGAARSETGPSAAETGQSAAETGLSAAASEIKLMVLHRERTHTVVSGETVSSIAADYGIPYPWIQQANPNLGEMMYVGQKVIIPSPDPLLPLPIVENKRMKVIISEQRMFAYENGQVKWELPVSTGIASSPTSPGVFQVQSHDLNAYAASWDLWMPYFMGIYRPVPDHPFMNGFHGFPTRGDQQLLWTNSLGTPVTFGCILLRTSDAFFLYRWAEDGVIVEVKP